MTSSSYQAPSVTIVIPARNASHVIRDCLDSVFAQQYEGQIEVIVADGSDDSETVDTIRRYFPIVKVISNPDKVTSFGLNRAIRASNGEYIIRCDVWATLPPDYVSRIIQLFHTTGASVVGGRQMPKGGSIFEQAVGLAVNSPMGSGDSLYKIGGRAGPSDMVYMGAFRRSLLLQLGGYDERLVHNQDYELSWRIRRDGGTVWLDPDLEVAYKPRKNLPALSRQYFNYGRSKSAMLLKNWRSVKVRQLAAPSLVLGLVASAFSLALGYKIIAALLPAFYMAFLAIGSVAVGVRTQYTCVLILPAVVATMHISWGVGFFLPRLKP